MGTREFTLASADVLPSTRATALVIYLSTADDSVDYELIDRLNPGLVLAAYEYSGQAKYGSPAFMTWIRYAKKYPKPAVITAYTADQYLDYMSGESTYDMFEFSTARIYRDQFAEARGAWIHNGKIVLGAPIDDSVPTETGYKYISGAFYTLGPLQFGISVVRNILAPSRLAANFDVNQTLFN